MIKNALLTFSLIASISLTTSLPVNAQVATRAKQAIVIDYDTGAILMAKNADNQMPTSSMSKVMTMYVVFEALKNDILSLNDKLPVSEKAWRMGGSKMFVEVGKRVKVEDLVRGVIIQSGNDATIVLAEGISGTEDSFAELLNSKAAELGMISSQFKNASGWPVDGHYSTARDLSALGIAMVKDFPDLYGYYSEKEFAFNNIKQANRNPLLYRNIGADGIKTGHTEIAGYGLIGSGTQNGRRVVIVVNGLEDQRARAEESAKLLEWGLKRCENKTLIASNDIIEDAQVVMGQAENVGIILKEDLFVTLPKLRAADINVKINYEGPLVAPVKAGQEIGTLELTAPDMEPITRIVYAANDVASLGLISKTMAKAKLFLAGL